MELVIAASVIMVLTYIILYNLIWKNVKKEMTDDEIDSRQRTATAVVIAAFAAIAVAVGMLG